jgi:hypothetical protein
LNPKLPKSIPTPKSARQEIAKKFSRCFVPSSFDLKHKNLNKTRRPSSFDLKHKNLNKTRRKFHLDEMDLSTFSLVNQKEQGPSRLFRSLQKKTKE